ncbi:MAG: DUF554 domain-containing protein [Phycisphaerales bacterium]|nr:DUF554 domain-containing protein [Phycisphaerales bacterium]
MWSVLNGTIVNAAMVAGGCIIGVLATGKLPERYQRIILDVLGLITITLGIDAAVVRLNAVIGEYGAVPGAGKTYGARLGLLMVGTLVVGALIGTWLKLHERLEGLGQVIHRRFAREGERSYAEGFLTASVIFCVGPLTLLGCLKNGVDADPSYLYVKALLDGFCAIALTAALGMGVAFSILTIVFFQGGLALIAYYSAGALPDLSVQMMNVVGGVILLATALMILEIKRIPVANMLPAIFLVPPTIWAVEQISPGLLMTIRAAGAPV